MKVGSAYGINTKWGGKNTTDAACREFVRQTPGAEFVDNINYGVVRLWQVRWFNKEAIRIIADGIQDLDVLFTHSNGANYTMKALKLLKKEGRENPNLTIVHCSPALNRKQPLHKYQFKKMVCFHSPADWTVRLSSILIWHPFGSAGAKGIIPKKLPEPRLANEYVDGIGHSDWYTELALPSWVARVKKHL